jgi:hypothetical protein
MIQTEENGVILRIRFPRTSIPLQNSHGMDRCTYNPHPCSEKAEANRRAMSPGWKTKFYLSCT